MNIETKRIDGILVILPDGRLDAFGSIKFEQEIEKALGFDDDYIIINMEKVPYLSSGGIRVLIAAQKRLIKKGGGVLLTNVSIYPLQVLTMAGMDTLFTIFEKEEDAVYNSKIRRKVKNSQIQWQNLPCFQKKSGNFHVFEATNKPAALKIAGDLMKVLHATLEKSDIKLRYFSETEYSIGLGALGGSLDDCFHIFGEMITIGGTMVWLPTDGNDTPDFLIPQRDTGNVVIYTGLNLALSGDFNDIILVEGLNGKSISISDLYSAVFEIALDRHIYDSCLISIALIADIDALYSSGVKISPVKENAPEDGSMIMDQGNTRHWMNINTQSKYQGKTMISFGVGLNLNNDMSRFSKKLLDNIFYINPANIGSNAMMLHNHGVVFDQMQWEYNLDLDSSIKKIVRDGNFVDMRHLLDHTRITRAVAGVSYITSIESE